MIYEEMIKNIAIEMFLVCLRNESLCLRTFSYSKLQYNISFIDHAIYYSMDLFDCFMIFSN